MSISDKSLPQSFGRSIGFAQMIEHPTYMTILNVNMFPTVYTKMSAWYVVDIMDITAIRLPSYIRQYCKHATCIHPREAVDVHTRI